MASLRISVGTIKEISADCLKRVLPVWVSKRGAILTITLPYISFARNKERILIYAEHPNVNIVADSSVVGDVYCHMPNSLVVFTASSQNISTGGC